jgi:hypothetical protein
MKKPKKKKSKKILKEHPAGGKGVNSPIQQGNPASPATGPGTSHSISLGPGGNPIVGN